MAGSIDQLLDGRRIKRRSRMARALSLVAVGVTTRLAAEAVGLSTHQDIARAARDLGIGRRVSERIAG